MSANFKFYYQDGKAISSKEKFISYYNDLYFSDCADKVLYTTDSKKKNSVGKNSKYAEKLIEKILKKDPQNFTDSDVALMLAWKIGKITHSMSKDKLELHADWKKVLGEYSEDRGFSKWNGDPIKRYGDKKPITIDIKRIADYLRNNGKHLNELIGNDGIKSALDELSAQPWQGIGTVYLITLLYFVSNCRHPGKCPIYDRFAMKALLAIQNNVEIGGYVHCGELPDKSSKKFSKTVDEKMKEYINLIDSIFGMDAYIANRNIDRALWVYGHLFKESGKNNSGC